jgi:hypothetical protein
MERVAADLRGVKREASDSSFGRVVATAVAE